MWNPLRRVRESANIIGVTILAESAFNGVLLLPLMSLIALLPLTGRTMAELRELAAYVLVFGVPFLLMSRVDGMSVREMVGTGRPPRSAYVTAVFLALGLSTVGGYLGGAIELFLNGYHISETSEAYLLPDSAPALLLHILSIAVLPPLLEEMCYRGFYFRVAERTAGTWPAIWITATLFWLGHSSVTILPLAFGYGLLGGIFRKRCGTILPSVVGHVAVNGTYILMNAAEAVLPYRVFLLLSSAETLLTIVLGVLGLIRLHRECGTWRALVPNAQPKPEVSVVKGYLTSIPMLLVLALSVFYMIRSLEFIA
ncbi:MAG: lysostaphin resistance A-like protein [Butyricicoccaceae bacterium]